MEIKKIILKNLGRFEELETEFAPTLEMDSNVTIIVGNNGAGKTTLLKAVATSLSWLIARLKSEKGSGNPIQEEAIFNSQSSASIESNITDSYLPDAPEEFSREEDFQLILSKARRGKKAHINSNMHDASRLAEHYRRTLTINEKASLPLIAFYPVERAVLDIPFKIREKHSFSQIDGYDNSLSQGVDFRRFFEWFREREDTENESSLSDDVLDKIKDLLKDKDKVWKELQKLKGSTRDRQLTAVRSAISFFMPGFENLRVRRKPRLHMSIDKEGKTYNVQQLSQGEKSLMALVGDIARRLAMMNPGLENPLEGDGVVLIDEVDMHLHPSWQRTLVKRLTSTFPNCQFILTTHSPLVISECKDVLVYLLDDGELKQIPSQFGQDANSVLLEVMATHIRNEEIDRKIHQLYDWIQEQKLSEARALLEELRSELPSGNIEVAKAQLLLKKKEILLEKNR